MKLLYKIGKNIKILRPLLDSKKKDLIYISRHIFGKIFQDPSNKNEKYLRTKIRKLIKLFEKSGIKHEQIIKSINNLGDTSNTLNLFLEKIYKDNVKKNRNKTVLDFQNLKKETSETRLKVLSRAIKESSKAYYPPRSKKVLNLIRQLSLNGQKKLTLGGCLITKKGQYIEIKKLA